MVAKWKDTILKQGEFANELNLRPGQTRVVCYLQNTSRKPGWKVKGTRLFGSFRWRISVSNGTSEKVVLLQTEIHDSTF